MFEDPELVPSRELRRSESVDVLEEWLRWGEEWHVLLRVYGHMGSRSRVLEIGCGLGRIAYALKTVRTGSYDGFDVARYKIDFLDRFTANFPNFNFAWADVANTAYNPSGTVAADVYTFPYTDASFDLVFAASVFTHMLPGGTSRYFQEASRVLAPGGRCVFSFFLLDFYDPRARRAPGFDVDYFALDHHIEPWGPEFAVADPADTEQLTAYRVSMIKRFVSAAGLVFATDPLPGYWSGTSERWIGTQDLVVLRKPLD